MALSTTPSLTRRSAVGGPVRGSPLIITTRSYDTHSNVIAEVDGEGNRTKWDYDPTYNIHPKTEQNPLYLAGDTLYATTASFNVDNGVVASHIVLDGVTHTLSQDVFCRAAWMRIIS